MTDITFATCIMTGQSIYKPFKKLIPQHIKLIQFVMTYVNQNRLINFDPAIKIHVKPMKAYDGMHYASKNLIILNIRNSLRHQVLTLLHELKHSEQQYEGRQGLAWISRNGNSQCFETWNGKPIISITSTASMETYLQLPWEVEAREAEAFTDRVWEAFKRNYIS